MTMIIHHGGGSPSFLQNVQLRLTRLSGPVRNLYSSWRSRQNLRVLENLPADTLKDIGWPTTDNNRMRIIRK